MAVIKIPIKHQLRGENQVYSYKNAYNRDTYQMTCCFSCGKPRENGTKAKTIGFKPKATVHLKAYE